MSRTERKLRQALAEIEALRADRPKMLESLDLLTRENFEMRSALREADGALVEVREERAKMLPNQRDNIVIGEGTTIIMNLDSMAPYKRLAAVEFVLKQVRSALGNTVTP